MIIIDVQGFTCGSNFICKEIAIMDTATGYWQHKLVNLPAEFTMLNSSTQSHINWTVNNLHGISWDLSPSEESCLHYEQLTSFIKENVHDEPIFVKGRSKQQWLERLITNHITNLHEIGCPNLRKLKKIFQNRRYRPQKYSDGEWKMWWAQYNTGVTHYCDYEEVRADLFTAPLDYSLGHCVSQDLQMSRGIAKIFRYSIVKQDKKVSDGKAHNFRQKYGGLEELRAQHLAPGGVGVLKREGRLLFYMILK
ncbi:unnamed protein product [Acanthoscelides obtectus]|uniref:Uncharacterized protein n=1 Tax=Acanthoscelides obtectus TaxID=200917 RepID=A0A9P0LM06_ACAOB|nr:unnamed protein product [Acanthoscelides obtectus]CAK1681193.1 O-acetyl-ADP-ribose deacetylase 1 [Acanthoscelides obtectus]